MSVPQEPDGERMAAKVAIIAAKRVLLQNALKFDPGSDESRCLIKAAKSLTRVGQIENDTLVPATGTNFMPSVFSNSLAAAPAASSRASATAKMARSPVGIFRFTFNRVS